ncbi:MAG: MEDS domain-containing protein [Deltaproteobacteria bacterium]|nr:MEDS domain-containing protein [Deltaproteobacteria bacterium]
MAESLSESLDKLAFPDHAALFHRNREERIAAVVPFLRIGLSRGEKCLLCLDAGAAGEILSGLRTAGIDVGSALSRGSVLSAPSWGQSGGSGPFHPNAGLAFIQSVARQAQSERYAGLRPVLDLSSRAGKAKREQVAGFCGRIHLLLTEIRGVGLCLHGIRDFPPESHLEALRHHPYAIHCGKLLENDLFLPPHAGAPEKGIAAEFARILATLAARHDMVGDLRRRTIRLKRLQKTASSLLTHAELPALLKGITEGVISLGYRMCWIGMADPDGAVIPAASWGDRKGYLKEVSVRWDDTPLGRGPVGTAIRTGKPDIVRNIFRSRRFAPWREIALAQGYRSVAAFPLHAVGKAIGALAVYAPTHDAFDAEATEELETYALQASLVLRHVEARRALAESEEKFRAVVEDANVLAVELDPDGRIRLFNRAAEAVTGYKSAEAVGKEVCALLAPPGGGEAALGGFRRIFAGTGLEGFTAPLLSHDGAERLVRWNAKAIRDPRGGVRGIIAIGVDVTESQRAEREKRRGPDTAGPRPDGEGEEGLGNAAGGKSTA